MTTTQTPLVVVGIAACVTALSACTPMPNNDYHGTVAGTPSQTPPSSTISTPPVPAVPVTITGSDEQVETADLVATGYTVRYQASSFTIAVAPVQADGSEGMAFINAIGQDTNSAISGTTTFRATGRTTFHVSNTHGPWSLTFTPLS